MKLKLRLKARPKRFRHRSNTCLNCEHALDISERYCSFCGQKNSTKELTIKELLMEFFAGIIAYDSRFRKTISALIFKPGKVSRDYVKGKRVSYVNPFRFFISTAIIFFLAISWINKDQLNSIESLSDENISESEEMTNYEFDFDNKTPASILQDYVNENPSSSYNEAIENTGLQNNWSNRIKFDFLLGYYRLKENPKAFVNFLLPKLPFFLFFYIPILSLFSTLIYVRRKIPYAHHLIFNYNQQAIFLILLFLAVFIDFIWTWVWVLLFLFYLYKSMRNFYKQGRLKTLFKQFILINSYLMTIFIVITFMAMSSIIFF
jgi:hypothetical protein